MFPRLLGVLALLWGLREMLWSSGGWTVSTNAPVAMVLFLVSAVWLLVARQVHLGAGILAMACIFEALGRPAVGNSPLFLMLWAAVIVTATEGQPLERALLLRVCASTVYAYAALSKINPSWLAGEGVWNIANTRPIMAPFLDLFSSPAGVALAVIVVAVEGWMAVGLWFRRTRTITAAMGLVLHTAMLPVAASSLSGLTFLVVLNFGLVALYPAFWHDWRNTSGTTGRALGSVESAHPSRAAESLSGAPSSSGLLGRVPRSI